MSSTLANSWRDESGKKWVRLQERTDRQLGPLGSLAIDALGLASGARVLDVGCGAGATVLELAGRVGATGSVVGIDISEPLLERARERVASAGQTNVELRLADAASVQFEHPFDALYSRFGVMFFDDPPAAFKNLRRALRPGKKLAFVCWQSFDDNPWARDPLEALRAVAPNQPLPELLQPGHPGPFAFSEPELVRSILERAGFSQIAVDPVTVEMHLGGAHTIDEAVDFLLDLGPAARFAAEADPALASRFRECLKPVVSPFASARGVWMPARVFVVTALNPASP
jgi:ubiquinone/menaquinone biosynthesis C-methylase UbiE